MWRTAARRAAFGARRSHQQSVMARLSTSNATAAPKTDDGWPLPWRVGFFSVFVVAGSTASLGYVLASDQELLIKAQEEYPSVVKFYAPYIGVPVVEETGEVDEEYFPLSIGELVGDTVPVACTLRSGKVILVQVSSDLNEEGIIAALASKADPQELLRDPLVNFSFVDPDEGNALANKSDEDVQRAFEVQLPVLPAPGTATKKELQSLLDQLRVRELEFRTQVQLGKNHGFETPQYSRALERVDLLKGEIKKQIKAARN